MLQSRQFPRPSYNLDAIPSAVTYPGVGAAVKLTADQKRRLIEGEHPIHVLSDEQRKSIRDMLGERYAGDYQIPRAGDREPNAGTVARRAERERADFMLHIPWAATGLAPIDLDRAATAVNTYQVDLDAIPRNQWGAGTANDPAAVAAVEDIKVKIRTLDWHRAKPGWPIRVDQLLLQSIATVDLLKALSRPEVQAVLRLTPAQHVELTDAHNEAGTIAELVAHSQLSIGKRDEILREIRDRLDARLLGRLTPEQRTKWNTLLGDLWEGFEKPLLLHPDKRSR